MKNPIFKGILISSFFYIVLMIIEGAMYPSILPAAAVGSVILVFLATVFLWENEASVHKGEVIILWAMVLFFVVYGIVFFFLGGGFV